MQKKHFIFFFSHIDAKMFKDFAIEIKQKLFLEREFLKERKK